MPVNILMPALSPTMEKGNLATWLKNEGDAVKSGDVLAEIETDKATMEVEAVDEGTLGKILVPAGTADVAVNTPIAVLLSKGETASDIRESGENSGAATPPPPLLKGNKESLDTSSTSPVAGQAARAGSSEDGRVKSHKIFASPLARRLAKEKNVDLASVKGSGPYGRVVARDIKAAPSAAGSARFAAPAGMGDAAVRNMFAPGSYTEVPHDALRKIIARRLMESKLTVPHFYLTMDCELDSLLGARAAMNALAPKNDKGEATYKLSVNDFVIKAMAVALQRVPDANVTWTDGAMLKHASSDIGVAVAIEGGLITPLVRRAESKTLVQISQEMKDLARRARARKLLPPDYEGGSTAISNLGMYGVREFAAIINPPHATILAVGAGEERVVARSGQAVVRTMMTVTLSTDHRAVDGALGAEVLAAFKANIEQPALMLV